MKTRMEDLAGMAGMAMIVAGLILGAGCEPLVDAGSDAPTVQVTITNATPGVYVHSGDGSVIVVGDQNETGVAPDMHTDNSVRQEEP